MKKLFEESVRVDTVTPDFYYFVKWKSEKLGIDFFSFHVKGAPFTSLEVQYSSFFESINVYIGPIEGLRMKNITQEEFVKALTDIEKSNANITAEMLLEDIYSEAVKVMEDFDDMDELNRLP